jgi:uncharacterized membrane protein YgdD (TMEM256/DUF423 family)
MMPDFLVRFIEWIHHTHVLEQIKAVDAAALFHNPYFLAPFICLIIYNLYRQTFTNLIIIALVLGLWYFSGTEYVRDAVKGGEVQIGKILPIAGVGIGGIGLLVYLLFIRQD